ncbi:MAG TPA: prepilin-type N-terminal cleavage/methylation domain-containing protein [Ideonella sp.]|jgi:prepilin-type N-terminal cleavage/methylation domain-containing protein|nr:prepilin-type N-terminal cleavage/methylation domain-containing protein [Ideonella sp.]
MRAKSSERRLVQRGFTMVELIAIILVVGVLAVVAVPKFDSAMSLRNDTAHDEVVAALRYASQTAQSHRRLVCADVGATSVTLRIATNRSASACDTALTGPDGSAAYTTNAGNTGLSLSPGGTIYFQPDGRATSDGAGNTASSRTLTVTGSSSIIVLGETGLVR